MIRRLVVPVDFSEVSTRAAEYAAGELAPQLDAEIVFVNVQEVSDLRAAVTAGLHGFESDEDVRQKVHEWIESQFAAIESKVSVKITRDLRRGIPEREICDAIREHKADLVVMGSAGIAKRIPMGSKAEYVIRHVDAPVVLIRPRS